MNELKDDFFLSNIIPIKNDLCDAMIIIPAHIDYCYDLAVVFEEMKIFYECHRKDRSKYLPLAKYMKKI